MGLVGEGDWIAASLSWYFLGMWLPYYPAALLLCGVFLAALASNHNNRVAAIVLSFSVWFALQWIVVIAAFGHQFPVRFDWLGIVSTTMVLLTVLLFSACAVISLASYATGRAVVPRSGMAISLWAMLLSAHLLHVILLFGFWALAAS
jgi:hypothetical protein